MTAAWRRYLVIGALVALVDALLPVGLGRDVVYCAVGASGVAAMVIGVRRNRPHPAGGWHLLAGGAALWVLGDLVHAWYQDVALAQCAAWRRDGMNLTVAVNLGPSRTLR